MKSSLKVDYRSRYSGNLGDKEPIVKVEVELSEDPRDALLAEIFKGDPPKILVFKSFEEQVKNSTTYFIAKKSRNEEVCDIGSKVFEVMLDTLPEKDGFAFVTGSEEFWFEKYTDIGKSSRSKGVSRFIEHEKDKDIQRKFVQDFIEFTK